ncbi:MAG: DUF3575 domain-containing protein [Bacteroidota bacterium]
MRTFFTILFLSLALSSFSQFEVKVNPISPFLPGLSTEVEFLVGDHIGIPLMVDVFEEGIFLSARGTNTEFGVRTDYRVQLGTGVRYYFSSDTRSHKGVWLGYYMRLLSRNYIGSSDFEGQRTFYNQVAFGGQIGYKLPLSDRIFLELSAGAGYKTPPFAQDQELEEFVKNSFLLSSIPPKVPVFDAERNRLEWADQQIGGSSLPAALDLTMRVTLNFRLGVK